MRNECVIVFPGDFLIVYFYIRAEFVLLHTSKILDLI